MAVLEGVLAIHKPPSISSYDVIRTVTPLFRASSLFTPLIERARAARSGQRISRHRQKLNEFKIGHGGTLDPLATGVLIVGIGNGTKVLQDFLMGNKEYECTILFGAATDSYDVNGKVTKTGSWEGKVTREKILKAVEDFKGPMEQMPPVYSAIRIDGKHLYDYARQGLPIPEINRRSVTVHELELLEWQEPEEHNFELPSQEADAEEKLIAERVSWPKSLLGRRKREQGEADGEPASKAARVSPTPAIPQVDDAPESTAEDSIEPHVEPADTEASAPTDPPSTTEPTKLRTPAAKLRMVVSSGFYVRSLCHDIGVALGCPSVMATLVRSRQSDFKLGENVIEFEDFEKGPEVWEPRVKQELEKWQEKYPMDLESRKEGQGKDYMQKRSRERQKQREKSKEAEAEAKREAKAEAKREAKARQRNTSSIEGD